jgi:hypothetical protein
LQRLVENALVENDLRSQKLLADVTAIRITPTGRYYIQNLYRMFAYMDLALQDTPFLDHDVFQSVERQCESTDMRVRFERCETFLKYLADQEEEELVTIEKLSSEVTWRCRFVPRMQSSYEHARQFIIDKGYLRMDEVFVGEADPE